MVRLVAIVLAFGWLAACAPPHPAPPLRRDGQACWKRLLLDWYEPPIRNAYPVRCYREALRRIEGYTPGNYWTLQDDLERQLVRARDGVVPPEG